MASSQKIRSGTIEVEGLAELNKALRALGPEMQKELGSASRDVARFVADDAAAGARSRGGVAAHIAPSIKPVGGVKSAGVGLGGPRYPMAPGAEFGAGQNVARTRASGSYKGYNQFDEWKGNGPQAGYFVYPAIRQDADRIETEYTKAVDALTKKAFPN